MPDDPALEYHPGTDFEIVLEVRDPEGDPVQAWWPWSPAGFDFDPNAARGVWHVPAVPTNAPTTLILSDLHHTDTRSTSYYVPFARAESPDTGTVPEREEGEDTGF